jgi:hypothetical protein
LKSEEEMPKLEISCDEKYKDEIFLILLNKNLINENHETKFFYNKKSSVYKNIYKEINKLRKQYNIKYINIEFSLTDIDKEKIKKEFINNNNIVKQKINEYNDKEKENLKNVKKEDMIELKGIERTKKLKKLLGKNYDNMSKQAKNGLKIMVHKEEEKKDVEKKDVNDFFRRNHIEIENGNKYIREMEKEEQEEQEEEEEEETEEEKEEDKQFEKITLNLYNELNNIKHDKEFKIGSIVYDKDNNKCIITKLTLKSANVIVKRNNMKDEKTIRRLTSLRF